VESPHAIVRELKGLAGAVGVSYAHPFRDERGWAFPGGRFSDGPGGEYVDRVNGWEFMSAGYEATEPGYDGRVSLPVLWDTKTGRIVSNESSEIVRMFNAGDSLGALGDSAVDLYPADAREEIDAINERVYETVNNGVYAAGFARSQPEYERAFLAVFEGLDWMDGTLGERRYLAGERITEADWRLFPTLVRFDEVYHVHFRCNRRRILDYPNLWGYARELYQRRGVAETVAMAQIKRHYFTTHDELNPKRIIPLGPGADWSARPDRHAAEPAAAGGIRA
jgi:putative glutathione S-transferase